MKRFLLCFTVLAIACSDDDKTTPVEDASTTPPVVDSGTTPQTDAETPGNKGIPLVEWVDDLVDHHTDDVSAPDTVDDKTIIDDENADTFNGRF